jgi:lysine-N-methylase
MPTESQIQPHYVEKFRCVGSECTDSCCFGWQVQIDRATYEKYQTLPDLLPVMNARFTLTPDGVDANFARINLLASSGCPFFSADRLCEIQKAHGAEYLSHTCTIFPRSVRLDGTVEKTTLFLSCPEAARLVLLDPELLPAEEVEGGTHARYGRFLLRKSSRNKTAPLDVLSILQRFSLVVVKDRRYALWQRLFILGMFCGRLRELALAHQMARLPALVSDYAEMIMDKSLKRPMEPIQGQPAAQLDLTRKFIERAVKLSVAASFRESSADFQVGIPSSGDTVTDREIAAYNAAHDSYYEPLMQAHPFLLENFFTNYILQDGFPFNIKNSKPVDVRSSFFLMCTHYMVIRTMLIGISGRYREQFGTQHVIKLVQGFCKAVQHNATFINETLDFIGGCNLNHPGEIATLIKN